MKVFITGATGYIGFNLAMTVTLALDQLLDGRKAMHYLGWKPCA